MDVIADLAVPLPGWVIADMLGVPQDDQASFTRWSRDQVRVYDRPGTTASASRSCARARRACWR